MSGGSTNLLEQRRNKLRAIEALGHDLYPHKFEISHTIPRILQDYSHLSGEELGNSSTVVQTAGRVMSLRGHGKVGFAHLAGGGERIQIYVRKDRVGDDLYELYRLLDMGDIIGVRGEMFRTRTGELTIFTDEIQFLAKSLRPLPEKWHGLADVEIRYRQRYLDLLVNPMARQVFVRRSRIVAEVRRFMDDHGYLEVETPMMQPLAGGATARPFETYHQTLGIPLYLRIAPELYLKRLTVGGFDRVYEINRSFRNEGISTQHNPEFTMLEFYVAYSDYRDLMDFTESLLRQVIGNALGGLEVEFGEHRINFDSYARYSMAEAIQKFWPGTQPPERDELLDPKRLRSLLQQVEPGLGSEQEWGKLFGMLFENVAEHHLIQPTFIYDLPVELSPLSKRKDDDPRFVERFELYVAGMEIANAYSELNDPAEQRRRFEEQLEERARGHLEAHEMDEDYVQALSYGMPPTAGEGIGIDRLTMVLTNSPSIRDVILFPQLRPKSAEPENRGPEEDEEGEGG